MRIRKALLMDLLQLDNYSGNEKVIIPVVKSELEKLGFNVQEDDIGNVFAVRGEVNKYPLLNAHLDQVDYSYNLYNHYGYDGYDNYNYNSYSSKYEKFDVIDEFVMSLSNDEIEMLFSCDDCYKSQSSKHVTKCDNCICGVPCKDFMLSYNAYDTAEEIIKETYGVDIDDCFSKYKGETKGVKKEETKKTFLVYEDKGKIKGSGGRVLGGDDKCGIFIALEIARLNRKMPMKILFTVKEEVGCIGITHFIKNNANWFNDVAFCITIDRRYGDNLLWSQLGKRSCSNEFASRLSLAGIRVGIPIKIEDGSVSDIIHIRELVRESVNISAGYHNPHDTDEYVVLDEVIKIIKWVRLFLKEEVNNG